LNSPVINNGSGGQYRKYKDVRKHVELLVDEDHTIQQIARILDMPEHSIHKGSRAYRIRTGKFQIQKSRSMAIV